MSAFDVVPTCHIVRVAEIRDSRMFSGPAQVDANLEPALVTKSKGVVRTDAEPRESFEGVV